MLATIFWDALPWWRDTLYISPLRALTNQSDKRYNNQSELTNVWVIYLHMTKLVTYIEVFIFRWLQCDWKFNTPDLVNPEKPQKTKKLIFIKHKKLT